MHRAVTRTELVAGLFLFLALADGAPAADDEAAPARVEVRLPAAARLYVDDVRCTTTSDFRVLETPKLQPGTKYVYTLRAEIDRDGRKVSATKKVFVRAGKTTEVDFGDLRGDKDADEPAPKAGGEARKPAAGGKDDQFKLSEEEQELLDRTNREREKEGLTPLRANAKLFRAARRHSANMARQGRLAHELDGKDPGDRIAEAGYVSAGWGENCAAGQRTPAEAVRSWMTSPGHRANILNGAFTEVGLGIAPREDGGSYFTQVFATPGGR